MVGGKPIIIDSKRNSANIDINSLKNKNLNTAIVPHMFGLPIKIPKDQFSFPIIEDCAQALGARINNEPVGLQSDIGIFSFYATKIITSGGQGGALISKNTDIAENARDFRDFDYKSINKERFNFQMTDLQASIGRIQLSKLNNFIKKREKLFKYYKYFGVDLIGSNLDMTSKNKPVRYRAVKKIKNPKKMIEYLRKNNVKSIIPINDWELLADGKTAPCAYEFSKNTISLPLYPSLQKKDIRYISDLIKNFKKIEIMVASINQPAYLPWLGYFDRIIKSDIHIILDDVQFEKNSFINRNKIVTDINWTWLTVPVQTKGKFGNLEIKDLKIDNTSKWRKKHYNSLNYHYGKSKYFGEHKNWFKKTL